MLQKLSVNSYLADDPKDVITMDVSLVSLENGVTYPAKTVLLAPAKNIQVVTLNSDYRQQ